MKKAIKEKKPLFYSALLELSDQAFQRMLIFIN